MSVQPAERSEHTPCTAGACDVSVQRLRKLHAHTVPGAGARIFPRHAGVRRPTVAPRSVCVHFPQSAPAHPALPSCRSRSPVPEGSSGACAGARHPAAAEQRKTSVGIRPASRFSGVTWTSAGKVSAYPGIRPFERPMPSPSSPTSGSPHWSSSPSSACWPGRFSPRATTTRLPAGPSGAPCHSRISPPRGSASATGLAWPRANRSEMSLTCSEVTPGGGDVARTALRRHGGPIGRRRSDRRHRLSELRPT